MTVEEILEAPFQNDYTDFHSDSSSDDRHESDSDISFYSNYNEKLSRWHVCNSIISQPVLQVINEINVSANAQVFSVQMILKLIHTCH